MTIKEISRALRKFIEKAVQDRPDEEAAEYACLFPEWPEPGTTVYAGEKYRWNGSLVKVLQTHTTQDDWNPDTAPSLYAYILTSENPEEILEWVQPESTNPYMSGDRVTHNGKTWSSNLDYNVWEPGVYGWDELV